jgi:hypothetical protein
LKAVLDELLESVTRWAARRDDVTAIALVGSHARGAARPDSDVDLVLIVERPADLLADTSWLRSFGPIGRQSVESWGRVTSVRVWYSDGPEVEFGFTTPEWATHPDEGTRRVVSDGIRILMDREGVLARLLRC